MPPFEYAPAYTHDFLLTIPKSMHNYVTLQSCISLKNKDRYGLSANTLLVVCGIIISIFTADALYCLAYVTENAN